MFLCAEIEFLVRIVRMSADRAEDSVIGLGNGLDLVELTNMGANGHHVADTGQLCPTHDIVQLLGKVGEIKVAMAIDQHFVFS